MKTRPWFYTQRVGGKLNACRVATDANLTAVATDNESVLNRYQRPKGVGGRKAVVRAGRRATGNVDRAGYNQGHVDEYHGAMFPHLPMPTLVETDDFAGLIDHIGTHAIAIAIDLSAHAALRKYVSGAGHELGLVGRRWNKAKRRFELKVIDPAHPASSTYTGHWVPQNAVRQGAVAILGGIIVAELYPIGGWTQAKLQTAEMAETIQEKNRTIARVRDARDDATNDNRRLTLENAALELQLAECREDAPDTEGVLGALEDRFADLLAGLREDYA